MITQHLYMSHDGLFIKSYLNIFCPKFQTLFNGNYRLVTLLIGYFSMSTQLSKLYNLTNEHLTVGTRILYWRCVSHSVFQIQIIDVRGIPEGGISSRDPSH